MALDQRANKRSHTDTILYEIDMLRHIASTHSDKLHRAAAAGSPAEICEYYLSIEGFLFHARNLIAFFTNRKDAPTDLIINQPKIWNGKAIDPREFSHLTKQMKEVDTEFGEDGKTCHDQISKFLLHCTTMRYEQSKKWNLEGMFKRMDPILEEFKKRFAPHTVMRLHRVGREGASTATMTVIQTIFDPREGTS